MTQSVEGSCRNGSSSKHYGVTSIFISTMDQKVTQTLLGSLPIANLETLRYLNLYNIDHAVIRR